MKIIDKYLLASPKQMAKGFLYFGLALGLLGSIYNFIVGIFDMKLAIVESLAFAMVIFVTIFAIFGFSSLFLFAIHLFLKNKPKFWSPFQSDELKQIYEHLTETEEKRFYRSGAKTGILGVLFWGIPLYIGISLAYESEYFKLTILIIIMVLIGIPLAFSGRKKLRELLCSTKWAKEQGYKPESLKLNKYKS